MAKDLVCGMTVDKATAIKADFDGETYYFCSEHCKTTFLADPDKYLAGSKQGGCCCCHD